MAGERPIAKASAPHYVWGEKCDGWRLVDGPALTVIQEHMPPDTREVRHRHAKARQFFYVLSGVLTLEVEGTVHRLGPLQGLEVAPTVPHQAICAGPEAVEFLVISQPSTTGDRTPA